MERDYFLHLRKPEIKEQSEDGKGTPDNPVCLRKKDKLFSFQGYLMLAKLMRVITDT